MNEETTPVVTPTEPTPAEVAPEPASAATPRPSKFCTRCGSRIDTETANCPQCGHPVKRAAPSTAAAPRPSKFCTHCGSRIDAQAVICPQCGCQAKDATTTTPTATAMPNIVINNSNANVQTMAAAFGRRQKNKWVALLLCFFFGIIGGHKFYEEKVGLGVLYLFTFGLLGVGVFIDFIALLFKPNPYYV